MSNAYSRAADASVNGTNTMKAEFSDFVENTYHQEIEGISVHDLDKLLVEAKNKGGAGNITLVLSRSEADYISMDYVGKDQYLVQSERLSKHGSFFKKLFQSIKIVTTIEGHTLIKQLAHNYIVLERAKFENKYSQ